MEGDRWREEGREGLTERETERDRETERARESLGERKAYLENNAQPSMPTDKPTDHWEQGRAERRSGREKVGKREGREERRSGREKVGKREGKEICWSEFNERSKRRRES